MNNDEKKENEVSTPDVTASDEKDSNDSPATVESDTIKTDMEVLEEKKETSEEPQQVEKILKPGAQLAAYREVAGITLEQVASSLKMTVHQVKELEADNYEKLHGIAISRGFVRAYAKMLQVDPEPLVAMFSPDNTIKQLDQIHKAKPSQEFVQNRQPFGKKQKKGKAIWILIIIVLLGLVYAGYSMKWFSSDSKSVKTKKEVAAQPKSTDAKQAKPKAEPVKKEEKLAVVPEKPEEKPVITEPVKADDAKIEQPVAEPVAETKLVEKAEKAEKTDLSQPVIEKVQETPPPPKPKFLVLHFNGPSEIQLLKLDGSSLREFEGQAGTVEKIEIKEPLIVVVEKALHVQAEYRDQPLVLRTARKSPEARINLN